MKRLAIVSVLLSVLLIGCSGNGEKPNEGKNTVASTELTDNYKVESKTEEKESGEMISSITFPVVSDLIDKNIEGLVNKSIEEKIARYRQLVPQIEEMGESQKVTYEVTYKTKEKLSIRMNYTAYVEDLVTDEIIDSLNFDLVYGNPLELKELFKKNDFEKKLNSIMTSKIGEKGFTLLKPFVGGEQGRGFYLKGNTLVVYYQSLVYTTQEDGPLEFEIPFEDIKDILKDEVLLEKQSNNNIINEYNKLTNENTKPLEALFFIQNNIENLSEDQATTLILSLEEIQEKYIGIYEERLSQEGVQEELVDVFQYSFDVERINEVKNEDLKALLNEIIEGGYMIINLDGMFVIVKDYTRLEYFCEYLPEDMEQYLKIKSEESKNLKAYRTDFFVSWDVMASRLIQVEKFLSNYHRSLKESEMGELYMFYLHQYLFGFDNAPAFDYETNVINNELLDNYMNFVANNPNSETAKMIENYLLILEENNYTLCDEIENFRDDATKGYGN